MKVLVNCFITTHRKQQKDAIEKWIQQFNEMSIGSKEEELIIQLLQCLFSSEEWTSSKDHLIYLKFFLMNPKVMAVLREVLDLYCIYG